MPVSKASRTPGVSDPFLMAMAVTTGTCDSTHVRPRAFLLWDHRIDIDAPSRRVGSLVASPFASLGELT
jgi:hypothetical protein